MGLLGLGWTGRASLSLEATDEGVRILARVQENRSASV
jgi:hypothetical protein